MPEPLKNHFGADVPQRLALQIETAWPQFPSDAFLRDTLDGYDALELMPRGRHIAAMLRRHLPDDYEKALAILMASLGPQIESTHGNAMAPFFYLPHTCFVGEYGLEHLEASLRAQYELTQRFTAEFSIRPYLVRHQEATLARLAQWADDDNVHVRRLVSEGTRPRLPWAMRLPAFQKDPQPILPLLEKLKDDPELYVRRSVANNLNDIGKDNPEILHATAARWMKDASPERKSLIKHALRSSIKAGHPAALEILGFAHGAALEVREAQIAPPQVPIGGRVQFAFTVFNTGPNAQRAVIDFRVHFVKASGKSTPKVFKLKEAILPPQGAVRLEKTLALHDLTTRRHYPGMHRVEALVNGTAHPVGEFELTGSG